LGVIHPENGASRQNEKGRGVTRPARLPVWRFELGSSADSIDSRKVKNSTSDSRQPVKQEQPFLSVKAAYANVYALGKTAELAKVSALAHLVASDWDFVSLEQDGIETTLSSAITRSGNGVLVCQRYGTAAIFAGVGLQSAGGDSASN